HASRGAYFSSQSHSERVERRRRPAYGLEQVPSVGENRQAGDTFEVPDVTRKYCGTLGKGDAGDEEIHHGQPFAGAHERFRGPRVDRRHSFVKRYDRQAMADLTDATT